MHSPAAKRAAPSPLFDAIGDSCTRSRRPPPGCSGSCVNSGVDIEFESWVHARSGSLARTAVLLVGDPQLAEDLVQETLIRVAQHWRRLIRRGGPDAYAHRVLHNAAIDGWRRRQRRPQETTLRALHDRARLPASPEAATSSDRRLVLDQALRRLTPRQRAVLVLRYYEDYTEAQAALVLGCSPNTVKSQTRQALARVRQLAPDLLADLDPQAEVAHP